MTQTPSGVANAHSIFHLSSPERAKRVAKALTDALKAAGLAGFPYVKCQELVARMYGYRTHQDLLAECGKHPVSPDDASCDAEIVSARRERHVAVLTDAGIEPAVARSAVDAAAPTRRSDPRKAGLFMRLPKDKRHDVEFVLDYFLAIRRFDERVLAEPRGRAAEEAESAQRAPAEDGSKRRYSVMDVVGSVDITEPILDLPRMTLRQMFATMFFLEERGQTMADFERFFLLALAGVVSGDDLYEAMRSRSDDDDYEDDEDEDEGELTMAPKVRSAVLRHLDKLLKQNFPTMPSLVDPEVTMAFLSIMRAFDFTRRVFWYETAAKTKEYIDDCLAEIRAVRDAGGTLRDILRDAAGNCHMGSYEIGTDDDGYIEREVWDTPSPLKMLPAAECDAAFRKSVEVMLSRGVPAEMEAPDAYFYDGIRNNADHGVTLHDGSYVFLTDIAASAHAAGYRLADLAASAFHLGMDALEDHVTFRDREASIGKAVSGRLDDAAVEAWKSAFADCASRGRIVPDLVAMACMVGLKPRFGRPPQDYVAAVDRLVRAGEDGISLLDVAAAALVFQMTFGQMEDAGRFYEMPPNNPINIMIAGKPFGPPVDVLSDPDFVGSMDDDELARFNAITGKNVVRPASRGPH